MNDKQYERLLPCPWGCVKDRNEIAIGKRIPPFKYMIEDEIYWVSCSCGAGGPHADTIDEAIDRWNRRPGKWFQVDYVKAQIDAVEALLDEAMRNNDMIGIQQYEYLLNIHREHLKKLEAQG